MRKLWEETTKLHEMSPLTPCVDCILIQMRKDNANRLTSFVQLPQLELLYN